MAVISIKGFGVIADDLTGAMDTGAGFLGLGLNPFIKFGGKAPPDSSVIVISTDSRSNDPETASKKARSQAHKLAGLYVYKKIDSTLKGNIGAELTAVMDALTYKKAIVCPAFPANGRSVVDGKLLIRNVPISETAYAEDSSHPITESSIPALLQKQTGLPVDSIRLVEVNKGPENLFLKIKESEQRIIVVDAVEDKHLLHIAQALSMSADSWLACGSAGLARQLPLVFGYKPVKEKPPEHSTSLKPVLAVVGSRNSISVRQIRAAEADQSVHVIPVEPGEFVDSQGKLTGLNLLTRKVADSIACGNNVLITTSVSAHLPGMEELSARLVARVVARTVKKCDISGMFLTGGDVARTTCQALGVSGIRILSEIEPGVILGEAIRSTGRSIKFITKAGGFGHDETIINAIHYLGGNGR